MATYYVEPAVGNDSNAGTNWGSGNSWATLQKALDTTVAGDTVYLKGTETATAQIDVDNTSNPGTASNPVTFIGVNSSGIDDGTQYTINWGTSAVSGLVFGGANTSWHYVFRNFKFASSYTGTSASFGLNKSGTYQHYDVRFWNCWWDGWYDDCAKVDYMRNFWFIECRFSNSYSDSGVNCASPYSEGNVFIACRFDNNADHGALVADTFCLFFGCIFHDNGVDGVNADQPVFLVNCVMHGNTGDGVDVDNFNPSLLLGCRLTGNGAYGVYNREANDIVAVAGCYFHGNTSGAISGNYREIVDCVLSGSDTDYGYEDSSSDDYNLADDATSRNIELPLP